MGYEDYFEEDDATEDTELTEDTEPTEEAQQTAIEKQETFESKVEDKMNKVFGDELTPNTDESGTPATPETTPETTLDDAALELMGEADPAVEGEEKPADENTTETSDDSAGDEHALTPAEIRAALHAEWTDEEITELSEANPALAKKICAKALETMNTASQMFSTAGKKIKDTPAIDAVPAVTPAAVPAVNAAIDLTAFAAEYKDDPLYPVMQQLVDANTTLTARVEASQSPAAIAKAEAREDAAAVQQDAAVDQQLNAFFTGEAVAEYEDVFGKTTKEHENWEHITQGQMRKRMAVVDQAKLILSGAESQGVEMSLGDALDRAFLAEVAPIKEWHIIAKISKQLKKRQAGITLKPGTGTKVVTPGGRPSMAELEVLTGQRQAKCFG